jgi:hypothetical protein
MTSLGNHNGEPDDGRTRRDAPDPGPGPFTWGFFLNKPFQENVLDAAAQRPDGVARFIGLLEMAPTGRTLSTYWGKPVHV